MITVVIDTENVIALKNLFKVTTSSWRYNKNFSNKVEATNRKKFKKKKFERGRRNLVVSFPKKY